MALKLALGRELSLEEGGPDPEAEDRVMLNRNRVSRVYYNRAFFDYPISLNARTLRTMGPVRTMGVGVSYLGSCLRKLPEDNLESFYINRFGRTLYSMFFEGYTQKLWGRHPRDISADWGAQRVKGLSVAEVLRDAALKLVAKSDDQKGETSLIGRFMYPKYGPGQLWEQTGREVEAMGGKIVRGCKVTGLRVDEAGSVRGVQCEDGSRFDANAVFSSMPLVDLVNALPDATPTAQSISRGLPYRSFVTIGLLVLRLALRNQTSIPTLGNIIPDNWIYVQDGSVRLGRIQVFNNWSPYLVADPLRSVWLGLEYFCDEGDELWQMGEDDRVAAAVRELASMGVLELGIEVLNWHVERVGKAYPAYFDTYERIGELRSWLDTHPNLYCIGRNGQHRYNNMDHSMLTAFRAVDVLLSGSADRSGVWNVNTDGEYLEEE